MKNVQRIPGDTPVQASNSIATMFSVRTLPVPVDPVAAMIMSPMASTRNQTLIYSANVAGQEIWIPLSLSHYFF